MYYTTEDIVNRNGLIHCEVCNFMYVPTHDGDVLEHAKYCMKFLEAVKLFNHKPNFLETREALKSMAYHSFSNFDKDDPDTEELVESAEMLLMQYFDRSLLAAIRLSYFRKHPTFEEFIAMKIHNIHRVPDFVREEMIRRYGIIEGEIPPGHTYWFPKYSKNRKLQFQSCHAQRLRAS